MGGNQSQERIVNVEESQNEDGTAQITVTEDFLRYLHNKQTEGGEDRAGGEESHDLRDESRDQQDVDDYDKDALPYISAENVLSGDPTAESAERQKQRSQVDEAERWREKYEFERRKNQAVKEITSKEFDKTTKEIREKFDTRTRQPSKLICEDSKDKVLDCYHSNPGRPLNCTNEAKEFFECVEQARRVRGRHE